MRFIAKTKAVMQIPNANGSAKESRLETGMMSGSTEFMSPISCMGERTQKIMKSISRTKPSALAFSSKSLTEVVYANHQLP
mmetsp:Transcript_114486/g.202937  ORF Transcript_114486/g.202937 Transcript_114486/m.202937 type:complete len:81 (+) Transcript_114486:286-528(+)